MAVDLAVQAGNLTCDHYFQTDRFVTERKRDNSPVTTADKAAEEFIREQLAAKFPQDGVLGEEFGGELGTREFEWVIDPIDGTKSFISGVPLYSTLVALLHQGKSVAGVIYLPALKEIVTAAIGQGAWYARPGHDWTAAKVSQVPSLENGLFVTSQTDNFAKRGAGAGYLSLEKNAYISRTWGDGYGYLLVATGRAEAMVDPIVSPWDIAAIYPVIHEAGGLCTSWSGQFSLQSSDCIGSNGLVHQQVLDCLQLGSIHSSQ